MNGTRIYSVSQIKNTLQTNNTSEINELIERMPENVKNYCYNIKSLNDETRNEYIKRIVDLLMIRINGIKE